MLSDYCPPTKATLRWPKRAMSRRAPLCGIRLALLSAVLVGLVAATVNPASAMPLRQPTTPLGVPLLEGASEQAPRIGPLRARPAPAAGIDQPLGLDPVLAPAAAVIGPVPGPFRSFEGISNGQQSPLFGELKLPADTTGDVGLSHYVQAVNTTFMVLDKVGTQLTPPIPFAGPGGLFDPADSVPGIDLCDDHNRGDPVVLYDELADRWVIGQFAFTTLSEIPQPPFKQCVAVSATGDPLAAWFLYEFELSNAATRFPDYPKLGVWHDGYYVSANAFDLTQNPAAAVGGFAVALERDVMLAGGSNPQMVAVTPPGAPGNQLFGLLPADLDGATPPPGAPGLFLTLEDTNFGAPTDGLRLWEATVNWTTPSMSLSDTFLPVAEFDSALCGGARNAFRKRTR